MRKKYCCDASRHDYETYYSNQAGSGASALPFPIYSGQRFQSGHGIGSFIGGLFRRALPFLKKGLQAFGRQALKTGIDIANDAYEGQNIKESAQKRIPESIKRFAETQGFIQQSGSGNVRKGRKRKSSSSSKNKISKRRRKIKQDIFS